MNGNMGARAQIDGARELTEAEGKLAGLLTVGIENTVWRIAESFHAGGMPMESIAKASTEAVRVMLTVYAKAEAAKPWRDGES